MSSDIIKDKKIWVPERAYGVCLWILPDGMPLSDGDGVLSAEGLMHDPAIEKRVAEAAKYWTGSTDGTVRWVAGARKVSSSERDDQAERLSNGLIADPYEDILDSYFAHKRII
jgi:hypothetical protein